MILDSIIGLTGASNGIPDAEKVTHDELHFLLKNDRRRRIISHLRHGPIDYTDLVERMTVEEYGTDYDSDQRKCIVVGLYQGHLPRLVEAGIVDTDMTDSSRTVRPGVDYDVAIYAMDHVAAAFG